MDDEVPIDPASPWSPWMQTFVLPYVREPGLWPVLVALLGHVVVVLALFFVSAFRDGSLLGLLGLWLGVSGTYVLVRRDLSALGRPGGVTASLALTWAAAAVMAWFLGPLGVI